VSRFSFLLALTLFISLGGTVRAESRRHRFYRLRLRATAGKGKTSYGKARPYPYALLGGDQPWTSRPDDVTLLYTGSGGLSFPTGGFRLCKVVVVCGTTPGALQWNFDGLTLSYFPAGSNGTNGQNAWAVNYYPLGSSSIPSTSLALVGGATKATLTFTRGSINGDVPGMLAYRALRFTVTTAATHAAPTAFSAGTYQVTPAYPDAAFAFGTNPDYSLFWPTVAGSQAGGNADWAQGMATLHPAPPLPQSNTLTPLYENPNTAAGTLDVYVYYSIAQVGVGA
jgi:hypothetical protein